MKILSCALLLMASMAFVLLGCSDNLNSPVTPTDQANSSASLPASLAKGGRVVHSATGAVNTFLGGKIQSWAFTAREYADETCDGEYQINVHSAPRVDGFIHGQVMSLKLYDYNGGKAAVIGGKEIITGYPGSYDVFVVIDYGEGSKSAPDCFTTYIYFGDEASARLVWDMNPDGVVAATVEEHNSWSDNKIKAADLIVPIQMGNVQVR